MDLSQIHSASIYQLSKFNRHEVLKWNLDPGPALPAFGSLLNFKLSFPSKTPDPNKSTLIKGSITQAKLKYRILIALDVEGQASVFR